MSRVTFRHPQWRDVEVIASAMREIDKLECHACRRTPHASLELGIDASILCWTGEIDGQPEAIFGVTAVDLLGGWGRPWLLGTDKVEEVRRELITLAPLYLQRIEAIFPKLDNYIHQENRKSIRWLRRLGFVIERDPVHFSGEPMLRFHKGF